METVTAALSFFGSVFVGAWVSNYLGGNNIRRERWLFRLLTPVLWIPGIVTIGNQLGFRLWFVN